ncbi:hypothetical protein GC177_02575 [bacterium]|nr:hypothetical protein [bacterium]
MKPLLITLAAVASFTCMNAYAQTAADQAGRYTTRDGTAGMPDSRGATESYRSNNYGRSPVDNQPYGREDNRDGRAPLYHADDNRDGRANPNDLRDNARGIGRSS